MSDPNPPSPPKLDQDKIANLPGRSPKNPPKFEKLPMCCFWVIFTSISPKTTFLSTSPILKSKMSHFGPFLTRSRRWPKLPLLAEFLAQLRKFGDLPGRIKPRSCEILHRPEERVWSNSSRSLLSLGFPSRGKDHLLGKNIPGKPWKMAIFQEMTFFLVLERTFPGNNRFPGKSVLPGDLVQEGSCFIRDFSRGPNRV